MNNESMDQEHVFELLPAYALGILEAPEAQRVSAHLPECETCRGELGAFQAVNAILLEAIPLHEPPARLKERILSRAAQSPAGEVHSRTATRPPAVRRRMPQFSPWLLAFGLGVIALLAVSNALLWMQVNRLQNAPTLRSVALAGSETSPDAIGTLIISENGEYGVLVVDCLPPLAADQQYQLWLVVDGVRDSGGVFSVNPEGYGSLLVSSPAPLSSYQAAGVTLEPAGGSPGPTGPRVLRGDL